MGLFSCFKPQKSGDHQVTNQIEGVKHEVAANSVSCLRRNSKIEFPILYQIERRNMLLQSDTNGPLRKDCATQTEFSMISSRWRRKYFTRECQLINIEATQDIRSNKLGYCTRHSVSEQNKKQTGQSKCACECHTKSDETAELLEENRDVNLIKRCNIATKSKINIYEEFARDKCTVASRDLKEQRSTMFQGNPPIRTSTEILRSQTILQTCEISHLKFEMYNFSTKAHTTDRKSAISETIHNFNYSSHLSRLGTQCETTITKMGYAINLNEYNSVENILNAIFSFAKYNKKGVLITSSIKNFDFKTKCEALDINIKPIELSGVLKLFNLSNYIPRNYSIHSYPLISDPTLKGHRMTKVQSALQDVKTNDSKEILRQQITEEEKRITNIVPTLFSQHSHRLNFTQKMRSTDETIFRCVNYALKDHSRAMILVEYGGKYGDEETGCIRYWYPILIKEVKVLDQMTDICGLEVT